MDIKIYQINMDRDENRVKFSRFEMLQMLQGSNKVNTEIYDLVYKAEVSCKNLEDIYRMFNLEHPEDFRGHSLSVSDVVEIGEGEAVAKGFYFCDSFGYQKVEFDSSKCQISEFYNKKLEDKIADAQNRTDSPGKEVDNKEIEL